MKKFVMIIDVARCNNCNACALSAKDEYVGNDFPGYAAAQPKLGHSWFSVDQVFRGSGTMVDYTHIPTTCNHCDNAPCIAAAGDDSVYKRDDGIVIMDPIKTKGRREIVDSCPYGMISWNEEKQIPQTWIFDAHLIDNGQEAPRCVSSCPAGCFEVRKVSDEEFKRIESSPEYRTRHDKYKRTRPRIFYKNLETAVMAFIGGNVTTVKGSRKTNVEGATVVLSKDGREIKSARTDIFGNFKFDFLPKNSGEYALRVLNDRNELLHARHVDIQGESIVVDEMAVDARD